MFATYREEPEDDHTRAHHIRISILQERITQLHVVTLLPHLSESTNKTEVLF